MVGGNLKKQDCRGQCFKKINFRNYLPEPILLDLSLSQKLETIVLCRFCPNRMFILPVYASDFNLIEKYMRIWRNREIYAMIAYPELKISHQISKLVSDQKGGLNE